MHARWLLVLCLPTCIAASTATGQSLSGRLTSSFYLFERSDTTDVASTHARGYQGLQLTVGKKNVSLNLYGQVDKDLGTRLAGDGRVRMYNLYLRWKAMTRGLELKLGRQPVFSGVATGTMDGLAVKAQPTDWLRVSGFGGGLLPRHQALEIIEDLDNNFMVGGQVVFLPVSEGRVGVSFLNQRRLREPFETRRADADGNVFTQLIQPGDRAYRLMSLDASYTAGGKTSLYGRGDYDLYGDEVTRGELSVRSEVSPRLTLNGGYTFRSPRLPWNSIFSVFNAEENHEVEGGASFRIRPDLRAYANAAGTFYSGDEAMRSTVGLDFRYGTLSYVRRGGYAGALDGINASASYPMRRGQLMPKAQLSWASTRLDSGGDGRESLFSGVAGLIVRPVREVSIDAEVQYLHNRIYSDDVRLLLRVQYWFFKKFGE